MNDLVDRFSKSGSCSSNVARFLTIYIEEAHPVDEWRLPNSAVEQELRAAGDAPIGSHTNLCARLSAAQLFVQRKGIKGGIVCDSMQGQVLDRYQAWPERLYIIVDGRVAYKGGIGPFHYKIDEVAAWLDARVGAS